jgi:hypothetical protein
MHRRRDVSACVLGRFGERGNKLAGRHDTGVRFAKFEPSRRAGELIEMRRKLSKEKLPYSSLMSGLLSDFSGVRSRNRPRRLPMQDVLWIAVTIAFFAASVAYVRFCDRMK